MAVTLYTKIAGGGSGGSGSSVADGKYVKSTRFSTISSGTSGSVTLPASSTVVLDNFGGTVDAILSKTSGGYPTLESVVDGAGNVLSATFDSSGNYTISGNPSAYPIAIIYRVQQTLSNFDSTSSDILGDLFIAAGASSGVSGAQSIANSLIFG